MTRRLGVVSIPYTDEVADDCRGDDIDEFDDADPEIIDAEYTIAEECDDEMREAA